jgi:hypothetical protein
VTSIFAAAGLEPQSTVMWGEPLPLDGPGVYVVATASDPLSTSGPGPRSPISKPALEAWLRVRPELQLDGHRPSAEELEQRLSEFWLPDEPVLYIGLTRRSIRRRVREYYKTPLGARKPHAGGFFLKTLTTLDVLFVHAALTDRPDAAESEMLAAFCANVSSRTRSALRDPDHPFPFANLEWPPGVRKRHGLKGTREPR